MFSIGLSITISILFAISIFFFAQIIIKDSSKKEKKKSFLEKKIEILELDLKYVYPKADINIKQVIEKVLIISVALGLFSILFTKNVLISLTLILLFIAIPRIFLMLKLNKKKSILEHQLVTAIDMMANVLKAGGTPMQAIEIVANEMYEPIADEFKIVFEDANIRGFHLAEALEKMGSKLKSEEFDVFISSTNLRLREAGGSLAPIYDRIAETIRDRQEMASKIKAITSEGRNASLFIGVLPPLMLVFMHFFLPEYAEILFTTLPGGILLGFAIILLILGFYSINKITSIDV